MLQRLGERGLPATGLTWEQPRSAKPSGTGVPQCPQDAPPCPSPWAARHRSPSPGRVDHLRKRLLPAWCAALAHGLSLLLVAVAVGVSGWVGAGFSPGVAVVWLLSSSSSFLASFLGWEPLKVSGVPGAALPASGPAGPLTPPRAQVLLEALYFSLVAKRLHPDEDDTLVESPAVTPVSERVPRVRPPHGFALFLAKEEARKVKKLHGMLRVSSTRPVWGRSRRRLQVLPPRARARPLLRGCSPTSTALWPLAPGSMGSLWWDTCPPRRWGAGGGLCCPLGTRCPGHGRLAGQPCYSGSDWDWLTPGSSVPRASWYICSSCW